jgi:hypothetical protein
MFREIDKSYSLDARRREESLLELIVRIVQFFKKNCNFSETGLQKFNQAFCFLVISSTCSKCNMQQMAQQSIRCYTGEKVMCTEEESGNFVQRIISC